MTTREIEQLITQFPIYQYAFLNPMDIEFSDRVRTICKKECPRYGSSWSCPPAVGSLSACRSRCQEYDRALFFSTVAEVRDIYDLEETLSTHHEHERITAGVEKALREHALLTCTLSSDSCRRCERCAYPRASCRHPEAMHPCIESHGIVVPKLIEQNAMDYTLGENTVVWFSLIFYREAA